MRVDVMKRIDQWAGGFGCFALDLVDLLVGRLLVLARRGRPEVPRERVRVVLLTKYLGMGSIVLAAPMATKIRELFPKARLVFLTFAENREPAEMLGLFDEVLTIDSRGFFGLVRDTLATLWRLWRTRVDVVCDLEFFTRYSAMMAYLSGARTRVGYWSRIAWRGNLLTHPVYYNGMKHITRVFLAQAEALGATIDERAPLRVPAVAPDERAARGCAAVLAELGVDARQPLLLVNPNASELCLERRWMADRFARVVDALLAENPSMAAVVVGSRADGTYSHGVVDLCRTKGRVVDAAGRLSIRELVEALRAADLFVTNDSGPLHLATLVDTPTVALFGPETPSLYGPLGARQRVFYSGVYCSPCLNVYNSKTASCRGNNICLQAVGADEVLAACRALLLEGREGRALLSERPADSTLSLEGREGCAGPDRAAARS
jgi:ADP-heptose:LPS heptosyltransferase